MGRHLMRVLIAVVTFAVGVAVSPPRFTLEILAHGSVKDSDAAFSVARYRSSYFVKLWHSGEGYDTPEEAGRAFQKRLEGAVKVLERAPKLDGAGRRVGERAVAIFYDEEGGEHFACVLWTEGPGLSLIYSPSLMHVLDFERRR